MTERNFATSERFWFGVVTNVGPEPDGTMEARHQVRVHGINDDETNIPNSDLMWAKPMQDITSAGHNKIGTIPVGTVVGSTVFGIYLDNDRQNPISIGTIAKAGNEDTGTTINGSPALLGEYNSTPPGGRLSNNAVNTRANQNIQQDDQFSISYENNYTGTEQKDSDGVDITANAINKTQYAKNPTVASTTPTGSILTQLQSVDPQNSNAFLKQAIPNFIKVEALNAFGSNAGSVNVLGQTLGSALTAVAAIIGTATVINALGNAISGSQPSTTTLQALYVALLQMNQPITASTPILAVIEQVAPALTFAIQTLINNNNLTLSNLEALILAYLTQIQETGTQSTLGNGISQSNILNVLSIALPTISSAINGTINNHLPKSVLNISVINSALQKFAMNQAIVAMPNNGKKALLQAATQSSPAVLNAQINQTISGIAGISTTAVKALSNLF